MKQFFRYLFVGALALIPLFVVIQLVFWVKSLTIQLFDFVSSYTNSGLYTFALFIIIISLLVFIGASIEKAGKSFLISTIDRLLEKVPALGTIYSILKKITELFKPNSKDMKREVVLVEYPKEDLWVPSYVLSKHENIYVLFVPTSPNPTSGYTVIVDKAKIKATSLTVAQASQFIVSMGADFIKKEEISQIINEDCKNKGRLENDR
ncbi:MAG: DUF502 domain-containing protein [Arcobacteraceae bacterium]|nr:DUF502 domain-containing protein [Arcobacteraceae bacterium]